MQQQAQTWLTKLENGLTSQEKPHLVAWLNQSDTHYTLLTSLAPPKAKQAIYELNGVFTVSTPVKANLFNSLKYRYILAFAVLILISFGTLYSPNLPWLNKGVSAIEQQSFQTKVGEKQVISLSDGSVLTLNTNTLLEVSYSNLYRTIHLIQGEARFDVAKDAARPFSVISGEKSFTALGTIFNVEKYHDDHVELVVNEGQVLMSATENSPHLSNKKLNQESFSLLGPVIVANEKVTITPTTLPKIETLSLNHIQEDLAWQQGMLVFDGLPLKAAISEMNRYNKTQLSIQDDYLAELKVSGYFKTKDIEQLLTALAYNFDIQYQYISEHEIKLSGSH